ncbi:4-hydroxythreonine-4-phosphate dehydrogenase PdxA [Botryobacter ruber]|uniref:4-hydroxythreonine-4-phosphate dehydrogenase PdxA n=1 Tax=Botryobacter ruber TaxID=2171629 RepID=UPI000E0BEC41|nr:4-hydroxythreonine-4-phosphate dehydrogenase PdxA [Botryobacter ruber]
MESKYKPKLAISTGDTNGVGPEIIIKTFSDQRILHYCTPVIYGSANFFSKLRKQMGAEHFHFQQVESADNLVNRKVNLINCWQDDLPLELGKPTPASGKASLDSLLAACKDVKAGKLDGLVTAPINKDNIQAEDFRFPGHTEFLTSYFDAPESLMLLVSNDLRVATVTGHIPIKEVPARLSVELLLQKLTILLESLRQDFGILKPRVAVLGLNPHAGENGLLGQEDIEIIRPAVVQLKEKGHLVFGPYPADGFFGTQQYKKVDAVLSMYHDQGLIPFKTLAFETGVNFTAGLPVVRTSPDHGTAYNIASKLIADETSFREAVFTASDIVRKRKEHPQLAV